MSSKLKASFFREKSNIVADNFARKRPIVDLSMKWINSGKGFRDINKGMKIEKKDSKFRFSITK